MTYYGPNPVVIPFAPMMAQSVENLDWLAFRANIASRQAARRQLWRNTHDRDETDNFDSFAFDLHMKVVNELVIRARRSAPKRRLR